MVINDQVLHRTMVSKAPPAMNRPKFHTYIATTALRRNQIMTMGPNVLAILVVPRGWIAKSSTRTAHETPVIVDNVILEFTTVKPEIKLTKRSTGNTGFLTLNRSKN